MPDFEDRLDSLIARARSSDQDGKAALKAIHDLRYDELTEWQSTLMLERALAETEPELLQQRLVLASHPTPSQVPHYERIGLDTTDWVRRIVLDKLASIEDEEAAVAFVRIVDRCAPDQLPNLAPAALLRVLGGLCDLPLKPAVVHKLAGAWTTAAHAETDVPEALRVRAARLFAQAADELWSALEPQQTDEPFFWYDDDDYSSGAVGLTELVSALGCTQADDEVLRVCRAVQRARDPYLRRAAVHALLALGCTPEDEALARTAAFSGTRNELHAYLEHCGQGERFPAEHATLASFAEGRLAAWLASPWENGRVPAEMELVESIELETNDAELGTATFFYFRFRDEPGFDDHGSWQLGLSGPFFAGETSDGYALGMTGFAGEPEDLDGSKEDLPEALARRIAARRDQA